ITTIQDGQHKIETENQALVIALHAIRDIRSSKTTPIYQANITISISAKKIATSTALHMKETKITDILGATIAIDKTLTTVTQTREDIIGTDRRLIERIINTERADSVGEI